ncbi:MAG: AEC family transporter [Eubacteriaceae bacterium]|nr:AEC family transporter [Eubacteriaceae bacterium]
MNSTLESLNSLVMIFVMIIPGIILAKKNILSVGQSEGISSLVANVTWPCLVIDAMQISFSKQILKDCGYTFIIMIIVFIAAFLIGILVVKFLKMKKHQGYIFTFMLIFANTGFMGIPVINALYGKEAVFYASIVEMVNDIFLFTVGIMLIQMSAGADRKMNLKSMLSPGMFGVIIGFLLFLFDFQLPGFLGDSVQIIGAATTPLTMIAIGLQIGRIPFRKLVGDINMYVLSAFKLLIIPGIVFVIMIFILKDVSLLSKVIIMEFAMPVAACTTIFSQQYKGDVEFATKGVLLSTVLSIATLPIFTVILSMFG